MVGNSLFLCHTFNRNCGWELKREDYVTLSVVPKYSKEQENK